MTTTRACRPFRLALTAALLCAATVSSAAVQFSGQGIVYSARTGGNAVAVDADGNAYVVETGICPTDPSQRPGIYEGYSTGGRWLVKLDREARTELYRVLLGCGGRPLGWGLLGVDEWGNAYVASWGTGGEDFAATADFSNGVVGNVGFIVKLGPDAQRIYAVKVSARPTSVAFDRTGNAYFAGSAGEELITTPGALQTLSAGSSDAFVVKLNPAGTSVLYSTYLGGSSSDGTIGIAVDADGNAYVAGYTFSADFPITPGALDQADSRPFVTKIDPSGSTVVYSARFGGDAYAGGIAINQSGEAYLTGSTTGDHIPTTPDASSVHNAGLEDGWLVKLDAAGSSVAYGTYLGGPAFDRAERVVVDAAGIAYVVGETDATAGFPVTPHALQTQPQGGVDAFVTAIDHSGRIVYSTRLGGSAVEWWIQAAIDSTGDLYVTGYSGAESSGYDPSWSTDFPYTPGAVDTAMAVDIEHRPARAFLTKLVARTSFAASALSSSVEHPSLGPANAIDGDPQTRWSSAFNDSEGLYIDLGRRMLIDRIVLNWETAYADSYEIRVADADVLNDNVLWTTIYSTTSGDGGVDDIRNLFVTGRHVWLQGRHRATPWGHSVFETAVFGTPAAPDNLPPTISLLSPANGAHFVGPIDIDVVVDARDPDGAIARVVYVVDGGTVQIATTPPFSGRLTFVAGQHSIVVFAVDDAGVRSPNASVRISVETGQAGGNLALGRPALASSVEAPSLSAERAFDGNLGTRWSSAFSDSQWIEVDLGNRFYINTVVLNWETAYAASFELQASFDRTQWRTFMSGTGFPGVQTLTGLDGIGRFVRLVGIARGTPWGYSLHEFEVYGTDVYPGLRNIAAGKPTVASSTEREGLEPERASDSITNTRWSSQWTDNQWIDIDLGATRTIEQIVLRWETAFAAEYLVQVSEDASVWRTVRAVETEGGVDMLSNIGTTARFVRVYALRRATEWGISLWEFEVYGN